MSDRANKPGSEAENPIASLKPRSKPKERALPFDMDQILAVKDDVASRQWKTPADASGQSAHGRETTELRVPTSPETHDDQGPSETTAGPAPRRSAIASRVGKTRAPAPRDEHPLFKRDLVKVNVRMTREERDELHIYARRNGKSVQTLLEEFVRKILKTIDRSR
jgi:hypothetical protein